MSYCPAKLRFSHFLLTLLVACLFPLFSAGAEEWVIDSAHSDLSFKIRHLGISSVRGSYGTFEGTFEFDKDKIENSSVTAIIDLGSINTNNGKRDKHLRSCDFFCVENFAKMTFTSDSIKKKSETEFDIIGTLNLHGMKKKITLTTELVGTAKDDYGNEKIAFSAQAKLNRKDFGLKWNEITEAGGLLVGEDVLITLDMTGKKAPKK